MNNFYVYRYSDQNDIPFYIGKGRGDRFAVCKHLSNYQPFLRRKIKKVGADNIKVHFLHENLTEAKAFKFEIFYINFYGRRDLGKGTLCNLTDGGEGMSGMKHSEETKIRLSKINKGKNHPNYGKRGKETSMFGKHLSEEAKRKISEANKGKKFSKETCQKMSERVQGKNNPMYGKRGKNNPLYGRHRSKEIKRKLSIINKGKHHSEETKRKMSIAKKGNQNSKGYIHSEEHKRKVSEAMKGENHPMYGKHLSEKIKMKISKAHKGKHHSEKTKKKMSKARKLYLVKKKNESL